MSLEDLMKREDFSAMIKRLLTDCGRYEGY